MLTQAKFCWSTVFTLGVYNFYQFICYTKIDLPVKVIAYLRISSAGSTESLKKDLAPNAGSSDQCLTVEKRASNE